MKMRNVPSAEVRPNITIRISGKLFQGHLAYLDQLIQSAVECQLWAVLDLAELAEVDRAALLFLVEGEASEFGIVSCPIFIRDWMEHERKQTAA
jgi:hypothetical protein